MGTSIKLTVGGVSLDYSKNHMGFDWGHLFQDGDLSRRRVDQIDYDYYAQHPEEEDELAIAEETFVRPLARVLPRLAILGHSLESARAEYEAVLADAASMEDYGVASGSSLLTFQEFCALANRYPLAELSDVKRRSKLTPDRRPILTPLASVPGPAARRVAVS